MSGENLLLHPADQPVFRLLVDARGCSCQVRVNDVPVWENTGGLAARVVLAINEWLFSGENPVSLHLTAPPGHTGDPGSYAALPETAAVQCTLLYKRNRAPWLATKELLPWHYAHRTDHRNAGIFHPEGPSSAPEQDHGHGHDPSRDHHHAAAPAPPPAAAPASGARPGQDLATGGLQILHPGETAPLTIVPAPADWLPSGNGITGGFKLTLPPVWPLCAWQRALDLTAMPALDYTVSRLVRSVCDALQRRDWHGLRRLFGDRRAALQTAYYLNEAGSDEALAFPALIQPQETKVIIPDPQSIRAELCGGGKLLRAVAIAEETTAPAVSLICPTLGCQADIETFWMNTGQEWRLAR